MIYLSVVAILNSSYQVMLGNYNTKKAMNFQSSMQLRSGTAEIIQESQSSVKTGEVIQSHNIRENL